MNCALENHWTLGKISNISIFLRKHGGKTGAELKAEENETLP